jgi:hypothetical protein
MVDLLVFSFDLPCLTWEPLSEFLTKIADCNT